MLLHLRAELAVTDNDICLLQVSESRMVATWPAMPAVEQLK